jgi:hypothetical protein
MPEYVYWVVGVVVVVVAGWLWNRHAKPSVVPGTEMPSIVDVRINTATVDALLETMRDLLRAEDSRSNSLTGRGTSVAGFVGILVSVATAFAKTLASGAPAIGGTAKDLALRLLIAGLALLSAAGLAAVGWVVFPAPGWVIGEEEVKRYDQPEFVFAETVLVKGTVLRGLIETFVSERHRTDRKANALKLSLVLLILGVLCLAGEGAIIGYETFS